MVLENDAESAQAGESEDSGNCSPTGSLESLLNVTLADPGSSNQIKSDNGTNAQSSSFPILEERNWMLNPENIGVDESVTREDVCFFCGLTPEAASELGLRVEKCIFCEVVYSCSEVHLQIHRPKTKCFPFIIKRSKTVGRYMVASRDIGPCELILSEEPAVVGPYAKTVPGCLQCFKKVDESFLCPGCNFPMCNAECANGILHKDECNFFQKSDFRLEPYTSPLESLIQSHNQINVGSTIGLAGLTSVAGRKLVRRPSSNLVCITPLRMLLKRDSDPKSYALISMLMDHEKKEEGRKVRDKQINLPLVNAALMLQEVSLKMSKFSPADIQRVIGILRTNGMKMEPHGDKGIPGVVIYPIYCLINHACYNNTNYVKFPDLHLELRSQLPIKKGEQISTRYVSSTIGNYRRRDDIRRYWFFDCTCRRCSDATEFGTNMSAIFCFSCHNGYMLPLDSLDQSSDWVCNKCHNTIGHNTVDEVLTALELQLVEYLHCETHVLEEMLFHFSKLLHPNHYILVDIMHNLIHVYASKSILTRPEKERKIQLCVTVLETLGKVDPGFTKWRGTLLQELIHPLMLISKEDHEANRITSREFHRRLQFCTKKLLEARRCLSEGFTSFDPKDPPELTGRILERRAKQKI